MARFTEAREGEMTSSLLKHDALKDWAEWTCAFLAGAYAALIFIAWAAGWLSIPNGVTH